MKLTAFSKDAFFSGVSVMPHHALNNFWLGVIGAGLVVVAGDSAGCDVGWVVAGFAGADVG